MEASVSSLEDKNQHRDITTTCACVCYVTDAAIEITRTRKDFFAPPSAMFLNERAF